MAEYRVLINGETVWGEVIPGPGRAANFPATYRGRPESGEVVLEIDGEVIATMRTREADDVAVAALRAKERNQRISYARAILSAEGVES